MGHGFQFANCWYITRLGNSPESHSGDWNNGEGYRCFFIASSCAKTTYINIPISQKLPILGPTRNNMGMDQYLLIPFLGRWTSIYQLFWFSPGVQGFDTLPYVCFFFDQCFVSRNGEFFRSWLLRWYPVVDRHAAIESLQAAVCRGMTQAGWVEKAEINWGVENRNSL